MLAGLDEKSRRLLAEAEARRKALSDEDDTKISPTGTWVLEDKTLAATLALPGAPERDTSATTARNRALSGDGDWRHAARRRKLDSQTTTTAQMPRDRRRRRWIWISTGSRLRSPLTRSSSRARAPRGRSLCH